MRAKLAIVIPWFGPWPEWIDFFVESCRRNRSVRWFLFSDQQPPLNTASNVTHKRVEFTDYVQTVADALGIRVAAEQPYKLCELRPALPFVHTDLLQGFDFVGTGDLDVIYGNLAAFYDDQLFANYDLFSTHANRLSGHLTLMRNEPRLLEAFRRVRGWEKAFGSPEYLGFDERALYNLVRAKPRLPFGKPRGEPIRGYFREAYSTPSATDRMRWFWKDGVLTNEFYPHHPLMYLHFMSWHSNRWFAEQPGVAPGAAAPWQRLPKVVQMDWRDARKDGFMISPQGITPIERTIYRA